MKIMFILALVAAPILAPIGGMGVGTWIAFVCLFGYIYNLQLILEAKENRDEKRHGEIMDAMGKIYGLNESTYTVSNKCRLSINDVKRAMDLPYDRGLGEGK